MLNFKLAFASHLPLQPSGGGLHSDTFNIHSQLKRGFPVVNYCNIVLCIGPVEAASSKLHPKDAASPGKVLSILSKIFRATAQQVSNSVSLDVDAVFFRSSTRWVGCWPTVLYFVHTDVVFHTFFHNTFGLSEIIASDLQRIWHKARNFLEGATAILF